MLLFDDRLKFIIESKFLIPLYIRQTASSLLFFVLNSVVDHSSRARVTGRPRSCEERGRKPERRKKSPFSPEFW